MGLRSKSEYKTVNNLNRLENHVGLLLGNPADTMFGLPTRCQIYTGIYTIKRKITTCCIQPV